MPKKPKLPLVAICGRPNVGKSTLFNRFTGRQQAIVHSEEGITRDRFIVPAEWNGRRFRAVDTGGIIENPIDSISRKMQEQVRAALTEADVIVFVVDGQQALTRVDYELRDELYRYGKPVILAINKLDNPKMEMQRFNFYELGLGEPYAISSTHALGLEPLMDAVMAHLPESAPPPSENIEPVEIPVTKVAVVGKPNVGKSSFINAILNEERSIVDETPGTTRESSVSGRVLQHQPRAAGHSPRRRLPHHGRGHRGHHGTGQAHHWLRHGKRHRHGARLYEVGFGGRPRKTLQGTRRRGFGPDAAYRFRAAPHALDLNPSAPVRRLRTH